MNHAAVVRAWLLTAFWISVIVLESFFGSSAHTSLFILPVLRFLFPGMSVPQLDLLHGIIRKIGHFVGYATLSFLFYRAWWVTMRARISHTNLSWRAMFSVWIGRAAVLALLGTLAIAGLDEWHQSFDPTRGPSVRDVALDETGGILAQLVLVTISAASATRLREET
ncbi:MAG: VanZ family protein [Terriglobales bacterium]